MSIAQEQALTDVLVEGRALRAPSSPPHRVARAGSSARAGTRRGREDGDRPDAERLRQGRHTRIRARRPRQAARAAGNGGRGGRDRLATESELAAAYPGFDLGAVPPLGGPAGDTVVLDLSLTRHVRLVFEAGTHDESVRLKTDDLVNLADATIGDVCEA